MADKIEVQQAALDKRVTALEKSLDTTKKEVRATGDASKNVASRDDLAKLANRITALEKSIALLATTKKDVKSIEDQQKKDAAAIITKVKADHDKLVASMNLDARFRAFQVQMDQVRAIAHAAMGKR